MMKNLVFFACILYCFFLSAKCNAQTITPTVVAGSSTSGFVDGNGAAARFSTPTDLILDTNGDLYVTDCYNNAIRKVTQTGDVTSILGGGPSQNGAIDGIGSGAWFWLPTGLAKIPTTGEIGITDRGNNKIRLMLNSSGTYSSQTIAGYGTSGSADGNGSAAYFNYPDRIATDALGNMYVADKYNHKIRKVTHSGQVTTFAGSGTEGSLDGVGTIAQFDSPSGIAIDVNGNIYIADTDNHQIRKITTGGVVSTYVGRTTTIGNADGSIANTSLGYPTDLSFDAFGNLYMIDGASSSLSGRYLRRISTAGYVSTLPLPHDEYTGIEIDGSGNIFITANHRILKVTPFTEIGVFVEPSNVINGSTILFGSVPQGAFNPKTFIIHNHGTADLTIGTLSTLPSGFSLIGSFPANSVISPGDSVSFRIAMDVTSTMGSYSGAISFTNNDGDESTFTINLSGTITAVAPEIKVELNGIDRYDGSTIPFGNVEIGNPVTKTFTIYNTGSLPLSLTAPATVAGYTVGSFPSTINAGSNATFTLTIDAAALGSYPGTLSFANNDPNENPFDLYISGSVLPPGPEINVLDNATGSNIADGSTFNMGNADYLGTPITKHFTIANTGIDTLLLSPPAAVSGFIINNFPSTILPGHSRSFYIVFYPSLTPPFPSFYQYGFGGMLSFVTNDADENPFNFYLSATISYPDIVVQLAPGTAILDGNTYNLGSTPLGTPVIKNFTINNAGLGMLYASTGPPSLPLGFVFSPPSGFSTSIAPTMGVYNFTITLSAVTVGTHTAYISLTTNDPDENPFNFTINYTVTAPEIAVSQVSNISDGGSYSFGTTFQGTSVTKIFTINNVGTGTLTLTAPSPVAGFTIGTFPTSIAASSSATFTVTMDATTVGAQSGTLSFATNDLDENPFNFILNGTVNAPVPEISVSQVGNIPDGGSYNFGQTTLGNPVVRTFRISNTGNGALTLSPPASLVGFTVGTFPTTIAAGSFVDFDITMDAASTGIQIDTLRFANNDSDESPFDIILYGAVDLPEISVSQSGNISDGGSYNFGNTTQGISVTRTFSIINSGTATLILTAPNPVAGFTISTFPTSIAAGSFATFTVTMDATTLGAQSGILSFGTNDSDENPFDVILNGTVNPPAPEILVTQSSSIADGGSYSFGSTAFGTSVTRIFTIANSGSALLTLTAPNPVPGFSIPSFPSSIAAGGTATFTVIMDATVAGTQTGTLSFANNDSDENPFDIVLTGTVAASSPEISVSQASNISDGGSYNFGTTAQGTPVIRTFTIYNIGTGTLTLSAPSTIAGFTIGSFPTSIAAGSNATFTVTMDAAAVGTQTGTLSFANNDSNENPFDIILSGTVTAPAPEIAVSQSSSISDGGSYSFGSTAPGVPVSRTFTISNSGTATLTLSAPSPVTGFTIGTFPTSIASGSSATFTITMDAISSGTPGGMFSFANNDANENPYNFMISGTVSSSDPEISVSEASNIPNGGSYNFGTTLMGSPITKTFTISNAGTGALTLTAPSSVAGFTVGTFPTSISGGSSATFTITLDASSVGTKTATISFANNDSDENPFSFTINGTVNGSEISVSETNNIPDGSSFGFGSTILGTPVVKTFTIYNSGNTPLLLSAPAAVPGFTIGIFPTSIAGGSSTTFVVALDANSIGTQNGTISFTTNDPDENPFNFTINGTVVSATYPEISVSEISNISDGGSYNFGSTTVGTSVTRTFTISNTGTATLTLTVPTSVTGFTIGTFPTSIAAGANATFTITMNASAISTPGGTISFATNDLDENPFNFTIGGAVVSAYPEISVSETSTILDGGNYSFGSTTLGVPVSRTFTISNTGGATLTLNPPSAVAGFTIGSFPTSVAAGSSATFTVTMTATTIGTSSGVLSFTTNDSDENPFNFTITGTSTGPEISVSQTSNIPDGGTYDFGTTILAVPVTKTFTIFNTGSASLTLTSPNPVAGFTISALLSSIAPGSSSTFTVTFNASSVGIHSGILSFATNDADENPFDITISGTVVSSASEITVSASNNTISDAGSYNFGSTPQGMPLLTTFYIVNTGNATLSLTPPTAVPGFTIGFFPTSVGPGSSASFTVTLDATTMGTSSGIISFGTNDPDESSFEISLSGIVTIPSGIEDLEKKTRMLVLYPTALSAGQPFTIQSSDKIELVEIVDLKGNTVGELFVPYQTSIEYILPENVSSGIYLVRINRAILKKILVNN